MQSIVMVGIVIAAFVALYMLAGILLPYDLPLTNMIASFFAP